MINNSIAIDKVHEKFQNIIFSSAVTETFLKALPFKEEDIIEEGFENFEGYVGGVLEALGGYSLVPAALSNKNLPDRLRFSLESLSYVCDKMALKYARRAVMESDADNMEDIVKNAEMTDDEMDETNAKLEDVSMDEISKEIAEKVVDTIKTEKAEYQEEQDLEKRLEDALALDELKSAEEMEEDEQKEEAEVEAETTEDKPTEPLAEPPVDGETENPIADAEDEDKPENESATEAYIKKYLSFEYPHHYVSLFSKLQDVSLEACMHTTEQPAGEIPFNTLRNVTLEHTLGIFNIDKNYIAMETAALYDVDAEVETTIDKTEEVCDKATVCAIIIYTLLETLNSMGIYRPPVDDIKEFIDSPTAICERVREDKDYANDFVETSLDKFNKIIDDSNSPDVLKSVLIHIEQAHQKIAETGNTEIADRFFALYTKGIDKLKGFNSPEPPPIPTKRDILDKEINIAELNKIATFYGKNPNVKEIHIVIRSDPKECKDGECIMVDNEGKPCAKKHFPIKYNPAFGSVVEMMSECFYESLLTGTGKNAYIRSPEPSLEFMIRLQ